jgi:hypothetical protein
MASRLNVANSRLLGRCSGVPVACLDRPLSSSSSSSSPPPPPSPPLPPSLSVVVVVVVVAVAVVVAAAAVVVVVVVATAVSAVLPQVHPEQVRRGLVHELGSARRCADAH